MSSRTPDSACQPVTSARFPDSPLVRCDIEGAVATVWLNRPDKHNGLNGDMFAELVAVAARLRRNRHVRVVILAGMGDSFCAGLDFRAVQSDRWLIPKLFLKWPWQRDNLAQRLTMCWRRLPVPVIAVLHGNCLGGGLQLALAADFRLAARSSRLALMEIRWGLVPDMGALVTLSRLVREDVARELAMTGRVVDADEALQLGLVTRVCADPLHDARELAAQLAAQSPDAVVAAKAMFNRGWTSAEWWALWRERWTQLRLLGRYNQQLAVRKGLGKDDAETPFRDR